MVQVWLSIGDVPSDLGKSVVTIGNFAGWWPLGWAAIGATALGVAAIALLAGSSRDRVSR